MSAPNEAPRTPAQRLKLISAVLVFAGAVLALSLSQPFYTMNVSSLEVSADAAKQPASAAVSASVSASELVQAPNVDATGRGRGIANMKTPDAVFGFPSAVGFTVVAIALGLLAAIYSSMFAAVGSTLIAVLAFGRFGDLAGFVEDPRQGGAFVERALGMQMLNIAAVTTLVCSVTLLATVAKHRLEHRKHAREELAAAGSAAPALSTRLAGAMAGFAGAGIPAKTSK